jgi:hypothetical protein
LALLIAFGAGLFSSDLRNRLVPSRTTWAESPLATDNQVGARLQRVELLVGDPALQVWRDRISAGIALGQEQQGINEKKWGLCDRNRPGFVPKRSST